MTIATAFPSLETSYGEAAILKNVVATAVIEGLFAEVTIEQAYENAGDTNIEAIYSFPLPPDATLLDFEVILGEKKLSGVVVGKAEAERRYEDAVTDGDTAIMLEEAASGIYTANFGNLLPGETAVIRFRYGQFLRWNGNLVRLMLPTTIAPRFGDPTGGRLAPHQVPEHSFEAELELALKIIVRGCLAGANIRSPSHQNVDIEREANETVVQTVGSVAMDRDFVLEMRSDEADPSVVITDTDFDRHLVMASFRPEIPMSETGCRRVVKIVVDCSGSMAGDSIAQAKIAVSRILDSIREDDLFGIVAFGGNHSALSERLMPMDQKNLVEARAFLADLDANMGGTEIGNALGAAYRLSGNTDYQNDLLLITDGEVWENEDLMDRARQSEHRIFTVGVGSSVAEGTVRGLAGATSGACELVSPHEDMPEKIHRHFQRMYAPMAQARIIWPRPPVQQFPQTIDVVFDGDTLNVFGWFDAPVEVHPVLEIRLDDGRTLSRSAVITPVAETPLPSETEIDKAGTLARMAAANRLRSIEDQEKAKALAIRYQLMSRWTNYLVVHARAEGEKATDLPEIRNIVQTVAAGWHGTSSVRELESMSIPIFAAAKSSTFDAPVEIGLPSKFKQVFSSWKFRSRLFGVPMPKKVHSTRDGADLLSCIAHGGSWRSLRIEDMKHLGVPDTVVEKLEVLADRGQDERTVVLTLLYLVCRSDRAQDVDRHCLREVIAAFKAENLPAHLVSEIHAAVRNNPDWVGTIL